MSLAANSVTATASLGWKQTQTNESGTFGATVQGPDSFTARYSPNTTTYSEILLDVFTLNASANTTIDFRSFTNLLNNTVTATGVLGMLVKATATVTGGQLQIEPGASNPLSWILSGTSPAITLDVGTAGACLMVWEGTTQTVNATVRNVLFSNPGTQAITVTLGALVTTT